LLTAFKMKPTLSRKDFLVSTCKAGCAVLASMSIIGSFESCSSIAVFKAQPSEGKIQVPLTEFAETNLRIIRVTHLDFDILVSKKQDGNYSAVYMQCTHQDFGLTANAKGLNCSMHGSSFDLEGNVVTGPAALPLRKFTVTKNDTHLTIS
jgi:cytochrome b6-f complex iron-sulfur subunit